MDCNYIFLLHSLPITCFQLQPPKCTAISSSHRVLASLSMQAAQSLPAASLSPGSETFPSSYSALLENPGHFGAKPTPFLCHLHARHNLETFLCLL